MPTRTPKPPARPKRAVPKPEPKTIALTSDTLQRLGGQRLAQLVLELSAGDAAFKRRLKLELSGPQAAAHAIAKRLTTLAKSKSYVAWHKVAALREDLIDQRDAIVGKVASADPGAALALLWQFLALSSPLLDRSYDGNGVLVDCFSESIPLLSEIAARASPPVGVLASQIQEALFADSYHICDGLIMALSATLGNEGLTILRGLFTDAEDATVSQSAKSEHLATCRAALRAIADARGDVDAFIESFSGDALATNKVAAQIGERLLKVGRAGEALTYLDACKAGTKQGDADWQSVRAKTLEALGLQEEAQAFRLACFKSSLNADMLRAFIKRLPDFDDEEALNAALIYARTYPNLSAAIAFLMAWPAPRHAAARIIQDADKLDGNDYVWLTNLMTKLSDNYPLAATLIARAMVTHTLGHSKTKRYKYAVRHIKSCDFLMAQIEDWHGHADHPTWLMTLKIAHSRKFGVWDLV